MNERIRLLAEQAFVITTDGNIGHVNTHMVEKFAELIVQDCANFVRETYDHESAEAIAWTMEIEYGLHGDYV